MCKKPVAWFRCAHGSLSLSLSLFKVTVREMLFRLNFLERKYAWPSQRIVQRILSLDWASNWATAKWKSITWSSHEPLTYRLLVLSAEDAVLHRAKQATRMLVVRRARRSSNDLKFQPNMDVVLMWGLNFEFEICVVGMLCCLLTSRNCSQRTVYSLR
jgi:hypothetical protein